MKHFGIGKRIGSSTVLRGLSALVAVVSMLSGCAYFEQGQEETEELIIVEQPETVISYEYGVAARGDVTLTAKISCTYRQVSGTDVSFGVSGKLIQKVYVEKGDTVKKGDLLAELSSAGLDRRIEQLEYNIARNELLLGYIDVNEQHAISREWLNYIYYTGKSDDDEKRLEKNIATLKQNNEYKREDYNDALEMDRLELELLQAEMESSRLYAPMSGEIYKIKSDLEGSTSRAGEAVFTIIDSSVCIFETTAPEYAQYIHDGDILSMHLASGAGAGDYELIPWRMSGWKDSQFFAVYDGPNSAGIKVGDVGNIEVVLDSRTDVLCVPKVAVRTADDRAYVYVFDEDGLRQIRWVEVGLIGNSTTEILSGLSEGERVILR